MTESPAIRLRAVESSDLSFTRRCRNDPAVHLPALGRRFPITDAGEQAWFASLGQGSPPLEVTYIVAASADDAPLGLTTLRNINWIDRTAMFGVWIAPEAQGNGAGRSATVQMVDVAFGRLNIRKVALDVLAANDRAVSMYRSLGFAEEGRFVEQVFIDDAFADVLRMAVTATAWAGSRSAG